MLNPERIKEIIDEELGVDLLYAGVVGSSLVNRHTDVDVIAIVRDELPPSLYHLSDRISVLAFDASWLNYEIHERMPMSLVPSVIFKTLQLSRPIAGDKNSLHLPKIKVCRADWINVEIKRNRFKEKCRKNYLVALIFEKLLERSPDLGMYEFNNVEMAKKLGLVNISKELTGIYDKQKCAGYFFLDPAAGSGFEPEMT